VNLNTIRQKIIESTREEWNKITCWGAGSGPAYRYALSSERGEHGIETEAQGHANIAVLIDDVDISIAWGYDPDESLRFEGNGRRFKFDFLPSFSDEDEDVSRMHADVFYRGALVDRELYVVADGGRHYVPIPRTEYPNKTGPRELGSPEYHYTRWALGFASILNSFEHAPGSFEELLSELDYTLDEDRPIWSESK
jgi:hypothetical protein